MKKLLFITFSLLTVLILTGCGSAKNVAYFQNSDSINFEQSRYLYDARIMPKDQITISVNTTTPEVSLPFNLLLQNSYQQGRTLTTGAGTLMPYLVDNEGYIKMPIIGKLKVGGPALEQSPLLPLRASNCLSTSRTGRARSPSTTRAERSSRPSMPRWLPRQSDSSAVR